MAGKRGHTDHYKDKRGEHMERRYDHLGSLEKVGQEFGISKQHAHRIISNRRKDSAEDDDDSCQE